MNSVYLERKFDEGSVRIIVKGSREVGGVISAEIAAVHYPEEFNEQGKVNEDYEDELPYIEEFSIPNGHLATIIVMLEELRNKISSL